MQEKVVLVNEKDESMGMMNKLEAHKKGLLHRAFSIFIFNDRGETLLQQRAENKYHSPLLWTNTCCSHPQKGESCKSAAQRRLKEEMGFSCPLEEKFHFIYRVEVGQGLIEHELDHVFTGYFNENPKINSQEVNAYDWATFNKIEKELKHNSREYTPWFKIIFETYLKYL